ncbi:MAG: hypothetical protein ACRBN8_12420 [Nannocystales bacterium]
MDWVEISGRLRAAVALGLAMGGGGCGPVVDTEGSETTGTTSAGATSSDATTAPSTSPVTTAISTSGDPTMPNTGGLGEGPRFDIGDAFVDIGAIPDVGEFETDCEPVEGAPDCEAELGPYEVLIPICVDGVADAACDTQTEDDYLDAAWDCLVCDGFAERTACEPFLLGETTCCAWVVVQPGQSCPGRPFLVRGAARLPEVVRRDDWWRSCSPNVAGLSASTRAVLCEAWAAEGCHEAASIASFSRFVLQLMSVGAPSSLIAGAQAAMSEEVEHARAFFGLARAYGGVNLGPSALPIEGALDDASDPIASAVSLATEGCIAETISAMQLDIAASHATDASVAAVLSEIAEQELRHAELAWSALAWMLRRGDDSLRAAVAKAFAHAQDAVPRAVSISDSLEPAVLRVVGRLTAEQRLEVAQRALEYCVAPAAAALLQPWTSTARQPAELSVRGPVVPARA